ncbi:MAG TPA: peroxiredoxin, partial [Chitinophagales bacterium]|nr:peroxiredoxin [Chitinophagales bacterium]
VMSIRLGDTAPDFIAQTTMGNIHFYDWAGSSWVVLFSHPADFTPVCTTELGLAGRYKAAFSARNVKIIALSVDPIEKHMAWISDIETTQQTTIDYPLIADPEKKIALLYDMIHPNASDSTTVRTVYVISPDKKVKLTIAYPASTGRNFDELLRVIDSLQLTANFSVSTPANWKDGEDVIIIPSIQDEEIASKFPKGYHSVTPYLRITPQPNK